MGEQIWLNRATIQLGLVLLAFAASLLRGGRPEILTSSMMLAVQILDRMYHAAFSGGSKYLQYADGFKVDYGHLVLDSAALIVFLLIAIKANRVYPLWIGGWQIVVIVAHFTRAIMPSLHPVAYVTMEQAPYFFQIFLLLAALLRHTSKTRSGNRVHCWRPV